MSESAAHAISAWNTEAAGMKRRAVGAGVRKNRNLNDQLLAAVHQACDVQDLEAASMMLSIVEKSMLRSASVRNDQAYRRAMDSHVAAHHRLWHLRQAS